MDKRNGCLTALLVVCTLIGCLVVGGCCVRLVLGGLWHVVR